MPTLATMQIPPPTDFKEFEAITREALAIKWNSPNLTKNGREGQAQAGVDIYGEDYLGRFIGVQCKLRQVELKIKVVSEECAKAKAFKPSITAFYVATTAPADVRLQQEVRLLSEKRISSGQFGVGLFFWDDLVSELVKNPAILKTHYPQLALPDNGKGTASQLLCLLDIAYYGTRVKHFIHLIFGEIGMFMAQEDPIQIRAILRIVDATASLLLSEAEAGNLQSRIQSLSEQCLSRSQTSEDDWRPALGLANEIEQEINAIEYGLIGRPLAAFHCGRLLGRWDIVAIDDEKITDEATQHILESMSILLSDSNLTDATRQEIFRYNTSEKFNTLRIPHQVYADIRNRIALDAMLLT